MISPITLITGNPGAGKTLRALHLLHGLQPTGKRLYIHGVTDYTGAAEVITDEQLNTWHDWAEDAVILVDECHKSIPQRTKDKPPVWIEAFAETRHKAVFWLLVTQEPMSLDAFVRRRVGQHEHLEPRTQKQSLIFSWQKSANITDYHERQNATKTLWKLDNAQFQHYKSATIHERRNAPIPYLKLSIIIGVIVLIIYGIFSAYTAFSSFDGKPTQIIPSIQSQEIINPPLSNSNLSLNPNPELNKLNEKINYIEARVPRVESQPWTAPIFDEVIPDLPETYSCLMTANKTRCACYTAQGVSVQLDKNTCIYLAQNGSHDPYKQQRQANKNNLSQHSYPSPLPSEPTHYVSGGGIAPAPPPVQSPYASTPATYAAGYGLPPSNPGGLGFTR